MVLKISSFARFCALLLVATFMAMPSAMAQEPAAKTAPTEAAATELSPQAKFIQSLGDRAIAILANKASSPEERNTQFRNMLRETFDLPTIARFVLGRNSWATATPEQQKEYMDLFETLVVKTYSDRFALYTGEGFKVRSSVPEGDKDVIVTSDITHPDGSAPTTVTWRVRERDGKMGILDVVVEGVSMSVTQRQEYSSVIQRNGGDISALLALMRERVGAATPAKEEKKG
ncbi:MAG: ABC transporter substrate-binding protein [Bdellovibrionales bacterium]|jgi:phospholipid transport system substrate-binding protein